MEPETREEPEARDEPEAGDEQGCTVYGFYDQDLTHKVSNHQIIKGFFLHGSAHGSARVQFVPQATENEPIVFLIILLCN